MFTGGSGFSGETDETGNDCVSLYASAPLSALDDAENQEAGGSAHLREIGDRAAVHVHVRGLQPGATYDVQMMNDGGSESIGMITTRDDEVPPANYFHARLTAPADEEPAGDEPPAGDGEGAGDDGGDGHEWWRDLFNRDGWDSWHRDDDSPRGSASFSTNEDRTALHYSIHVRGLDSVDSATLQIGDTSTDLDAETLSGSIDTNEDMLAALEAGEGTVSVQSGDVVLSGAVEARFNRFFESIAQHFAGRGSLRLDTGRVDALPLGAASIADLAGAGIAIVGEGDQVVLAGSVGEVMEGRHFRWRCHRHHDDGDDGTGDNTDGGDDNPEAIG